MPRGLPSRFIKEARKAGGSLSAIMKRAWKAYKTSSIGKAMYPKKRKTYKPRTTKRKVATVRRMPKRRRRRKSGFPLAVIAGLGGTLISPNEGHPHGTVVYAKVGKWDQVLGNIVENFTGFHIDSGKWSSVALIRGLTPLIMGALVSKFIGGWPLNVNRRLARSRIPIRL